MTELNEADLLEILKIIRKSPYDNVRIEVGPHKVHVTKTAGCDHAAPGEPPLAANNKAAPVRAPLLGTFCRGAVPDTKPLVQEGHIVEPDDAIGSVDVLGRVSAVKAGLAGTVMKIIAAEGTLVEYDEPLVLIAPHATASEVRQ